MAAIDLSIRDAIVAALTTPTLTVDGKDLIVVTSRYHAWSEKSLTTKHRAIVLADDEDAETEDMTRPFLMGVDMGIDVQLASSRSSGAEDTLRAVALEVQHRIANLTPMGGAKWIQYRGRRAVDDEDNKDLARIDLRFTAHYMAEDNAMDVPL